MPWGPEGRNRPENFYNIWHLGGVGVRGVYYLASYVNYEGSLGRGTTFLVSSSLLPDS